MSQSHLEEQLRTCNLREKSGLFGLTRGCIDLLASTASAGRSRRHRRLRPPQSGWPWLACECEHINTFAVPQFPQLQPSDPNPYSPKTEEFNDRDPPTLGSGCGPDAPSASDSGGQVQAFVLPCRGILGPPGPGPRRTRNSQIPVLFYRGIQGFGFQPPFPAGPRILGPRPPPLSDPEVLRPLSSGPRNLGSPPLLFKGPKFYLAFR